MAAAIATRHSTVSDSCGRCTTENGHSMRSVGNLAWTTGLTRTEQVQTTRSSRWASRACSRGAVCRRFKPWAHLGIVERRPSNGQAGRALPRPGCGPPRWPRPRWPAWAVSGRKVGRLGHQPAHGAGRDGKRLLGASGRRTRAAGSATCPSSRCLPTVSAASAVTSTHSPTA